jgi:hypothetical protein
MEVPAMPVRPVHHGCDCYDGNGGFLGFLVESQGFATG